MKQWIVVILLIVFFSAGYAASKARCTVAKSGFSEVITYYCCARGVNYWMNSPTNCIASSTACSCYSSVGYPSSPYKKITLIEDCNFFGKIFGAHVILNNHVRCGFQRSR